MFKYKYIKFHEYNNQLRKMSFTCFYWKIKINANEIPLSYLYFRWIASVKTIKLYLERSKTNYVVFHGWTALIGRGTVSYGFQLYYQKQCKNFGFMLRLKNKRVKPLLVVVSVAEMQDGVQFYCRADRALHRAPGRAAVSAELCTGEPLLWVGGERQRTEGYKAKQEPEQNQEHS